MKQDKIQNQLNNLLIQSTSIEGKIDGILEHLKTLNGSVAKHEDRIQDVELWRANWNGRIRIITILTTIVALPFILYFLEKLVH